MDFEIDRTALHRALSVLTPLTERKSTMPILSNVVLRPDGKGHLLAVATDTTCTIAITLPCGGTAEGVTTLPAKHLAAIVKAVPSETLRLSVSEGKAEIRAGRGRWQLATLPDRDFPRLPKTPAQFQALPAEVLLGLIRGCEHAILGTTSENADRIHFTGANLHLTSKGGRMDAADGHRCAMAKTDVCVASIGPALIPKVGLDDLKRALGDVADIALAQPTSRELVVRAGDTTVWLALLEPTFPNLDKVVPRSAETEVMVPRRALIDLVRRVSLLMRKEEGHLQGGVALSLKAPAIRVSCESMSGEAEDSLEIGYDGKPFETACGAAYLIAALEVIATDEVKMGLQDELSPILLSASTPGAEPCAAIMPMRL